MIDRREFLGHAAGVLALATLGRAGWAESAGGPTPISVYKSSSCGCCAKWVEYLHQNGFAPVVHDEEAMDELKDRLGVPDKVRSCHTAKIESYLIEGHVPATDIRRLLRERPKVAGLSVPGMPPRTPGMAEPGTATGGYDVVAFQLDGGTQTFARH
jgi:hypothetical protein